MIENQQAMRELLAGALLLILLPLTAQEKIYQITKGLEDTAIEEIHLLDQERYLLVKTEENDKGAVHLYNFKDGKEVTIPSKLLFGSIKELAIHPVAPIIAITPTSKSEKTKIVDLNRQEVISFLPIIDKGNLAFSPDGALLGILEDKSIVLFNWENGEEVNRLDMSSSGWVPYQFKFGPDGRLIACLASRYDEELQTRLQKVMLWDISASRFSQPYSGSEEHRILDFGFTSGSKQLYLLEEYENEVEKGNRLVFWENANFKTPIITNIGRIESYTISPNGEYIATLEYSYSPLVIRNLKDQTENVYTSPSPSNYKKLKFTESGDQLLMMGERLTGFSLLDNGFRTIYDSPKFISIKEAIVSKKGKTILFSDDNYANPNVTKLNLPNYISSPASTNPAEDTLVFVQMEDLLSDDHQLTSGISNKPIADDGACSRFHPYKIKDLEITNKITHHTVKDKQLAPFGLETIGFSEDEQMMVTYFPANESVGLYSSEMLLWNVKLRCPIQQFENQKIDEENYMLLTRPVNEIEVDQLDDRIIVRTNEHEFLFDIRSGRLDNGYELVTDRKNTLFSNLQTENQLLILIRKKVRLWYQESTG